MSAGSTEATTQVKALRDALVEDLRGQGVVRSAEVAAAFAAVPRHLFAPEVPLAQAYANDVVITKRDERGMAISSVSAPWLQATMLEQAGLRPGMRCLEIGSGGYNAALMAELVGPNGEVSTLDIDPEITERARRCLAEAGYDQVRVLLADAEDGAKEFAPYDRIIVTVGAWDIPPAWVSQLAETGRLVVPLRIRGLSRSVAFDRAGEGLLSREHEMSGFVSMQGAGAKPERLVLLHGEDVGLRLDDDDQHVDADALREALLLPRTEAWSGVTFGGMEPFDGLYLWLATHFSGFALLSRKRSDAARELVDPSSPIGAPTFLDGGSFAYHAFRKADPDADVYEFGTYAHGPDAERLAEHMTELIRVWDRDHRHGPGAVIAIYPAGTPDDRLRAGWVIDKRHTRVTISWP